MWANLLDRFLTGMMVEDRLSLTYPDGTTRDYGPDTGESAHLEISDHATLRALVLNPDLGLGEGFMDGKITPRNCTLDQALTLVVKNRFKGTIPPWLVMANRARFHMRRVHSAQRAECIPQECRPSLRHFG